jgi:hypothetical protein
VVVEQFSDGAELGGVEGLGQGDAGGEDVDAGEPDWGRPRRLVVRSVTRSAIPLWRSTV